MKKEIIKTAENYSQKYNIKIDKNFALMKLYEEMGEFTQAVLVHENKSRPEKFLSKQESKKELAKELADVVGMAIVCADVFGINIEEAIDKKWITRGWVNEK